MRLKVPHRKQIDTGYCLPACVQMVLAYWGIQRDQDSLAKQLGMIEGAGTPGSRLFLLVSSSLDVQYRTRGNINDLEEALRGSVPPIALVWTGQLSYWDSNVPHAVVLIGTERGNFVVHDPAKSEEGILVSIPEFNLAWDEMDNIYALLKKR